MQASYADTSLAYFDHSFDACENLIVTLRSDLSTTTCQAIGGGNCGVNFEGTIRVQQAGVDVIAPVPFSLFYWIPFQGNGVISFETISISGNSLANLTPGSSYDIVAELTEAGIPEQGVSSNFLILCQATNANFFFYTGSCQSIVDNFTYAPTVAAFTWQQGTTFICNGGPTGGCQLVNSLDVNFSIINIPPAAISFLWFLNGVIYATTSSPPVFSAPACGYYDMQLIITTNLCSYYYSETIYIGNSPFCTESEPPCCGTQRMSSPQALQLTVSPNPIHAGTAVSLRHNLSGSSWLNVRIYQADGKEVYRYIPDAWSSSNLIKFSLPVLPAGMYDLRLTSPEATIGQKLIVQ